MDKAALKKMWGKRWLQLLALLIAILCWMMAAMSTNQQIKRTIYDVPVDLSVHARTLANLGLNALEISQEYVDVTVQGPRTVVGKLTAEDVQTTVRITNVTEPQVYELSLTQVSATGDEDFEIVGYGPSTITVRFDTLVTQSFTVNPRVQGVTVPQGYILDREYASPDTIEITGPQGELDKIAEVIVSVELTEPLERTHAEEQPIVLLDIQGNELDPRDHFLSLSVTEAQVVVPVLKETGLPLVFDFQNEPRNFPLNELEYTISLEYVEVAGPVTQVERYTEIHLGYVDVKTLTDENSTFYFPVPLPTEQFVFTGDDVSGVTVEFNTDDWSSATFNTSNITLLNAPPNYEVELLSQNLNNITFYGKLDVLEAMSADDIVVEVDLSERDLNEGQMNYPVKISVPNKGLAWAVGDYTTVILVTEKTQN